MMTENQLAQLSFKNKSLQAISNNAGCYHCMKSFSASDIKEYTDSGETALCPLCKVDAVAFDCTGYDLGEASLAKANRSWFGKTK